MLSSRLSRIFGRPDVARAQFAHPVAGDGAIITPIMGYLGENHVFDNSFTWAIIVGFTLVCSFFLVNGRK